MSEPGPSRPPAAPAAASPAAPASRAERIALRLSGFRDWAQLVRLPNLFTAMADPLAGALAVGAGWHDTANILIVLLASACLYGGGIALNDWHDYKRDLAERPTRPLPSGRIRRWHGLVLAVALLIGGTTLASIPYPATGAVGMLLVATILLYDVLMKDMPIAPAFMGLCRALNLLLGMSLVNDRMITVSMQTYLIFALGIYVVGITVTAQREANPKQDRLMLFGAGTVLLGVLMLAALRLLFPAQVAYPSGSVLVVLLLAGVTYRLSQAVLTPTPPRVQLAIKTAVLGIIVFDAAMVGLIRGLPLSLLVLILLVPAVWLGKWLYST